MGGLELGHLRFPGSLRMNIHKRLTPWRREEMAFAVVTGQLSPAQATRVCGVFTEDRVALDRTVQNRRDVITAPDQSPARDGAWPSASPLFAGHASTASTLSSDTGVSPATVSLVLKRTPCQRICRARWPDPSRYQAPRPHRARRSTHKPATGWARATPVALAENTSMSQTMMPLASPLPASSRTKRPKARMPCSWQPSPITTASVSRSHAS